MMKDRPSTLRQIDAHETARFRQPSWALWLGLVAPLCIACGGGDDGVSYARQVKPLFDARCVPCHHSGNTSTLINIEDPFNPTDGLVGGFNDWYVQGHTTSATPMYTVVPFQPEPENSVLMTKITNTELLPGACDPGLGFCLSSEVGGFMPPQGRLSPQQIDTVRAWIAAGAKQTTATGPNYPQGIYDCPDWDTTKNRASAASNCITKILLDSCNYCHYPGSPNPPDLSKMFDPSDGLINARSAFRTDLELVVPGQPNASFLVMKIEGHVINGSDDVAADLSPPLPSSELGAPMPRQYEALSEGQVSLIRQWIAEGARNN